MRDCAAPLAALIAVGALANVAGAAESDVPGEVDLFGIREADYSHLGLRNQPYPFDGHHGCFPVGNGVTFAHLGVGSDFNTMHGLTGPGYQTRDSAGHPEYWNAEPWTPISFTLVRRGTDNDDETWEPVPIDSQSIMPLRGAAVVRTVLTSGRLTLEGLAYAVPQGDSILREFALIGAVNAAEYAIQLDCQRDTQEGVVEGHQAWLTITPEKGLWLGPRRAVLLPALSGDTAYFSCEIACKASDPSGHQMLPGQAKAQRLCTLRHWREWSAESKRFDSGNPLLDDMLLQLPVTIETQRDRASGGVSPLVSYHGYWVRDSLGPIFTYLENGRFEVVRRMLEFHRKACWKLGFCHMLVPLDIDVSGVVEGDWSSVGVEHAEVPSLIVLQHYWYWHATEKAGRRDDVFIREAWPFLVRNLTAMPLDDTYGARFHGDETYTHGALYSTFDRPESGALGYPNGYISTDLYSLDNTMLHRAAASALASMGMQALKDTGAGKAVLEPISAALAMTSKLDGIIAGYQQGDHYAPAASPVTGEYWPWAFSNISFGMYLPDCQFGALDYTGNYVWAMSQLWRVQQGARTTPVTGYHTGHKLGSFLLAATDRCDYAIAADVAELLVREALPDGMWCEVYDPYSAPVPIYGRINRIRPWESGVNYLALGRYLELRGQLASAYALSETAPPSAAECPAGTQLLVLTRDGHFREVIGQDYRLAQVIPGEICAWDVGWPFGVAELRAALLSESGSLHIPYLYLDRNVKLSDRRSFKTAAFWNGTDMQALLAQYCGLGGVVIEETDLRPAWALNVHFRSNEKGLPPIDAPFEPGMAIGIVGDDGPYNIKIEYLADKRVVVRKLAMEGRLANLDLTTTVRIPSGKELWIPLEPKLWEALQASTGYFTVTSAGTLRKTASFVHRIQAGFTLAQRVYQATRDNPPAWIPRALRMRPEVDGMLEEWSGEPAIDLTPESGNVFSGSIGVDPAIRARLWFGYDETKLYIAGRIEGAAMQGGALWSGDRLSLVFDAKLDSTTDQYPQGAVGSELWQADDYWVFLAPFTSEGGGPPAPLTWRVGGSSERGTAGWRADKVGFYGEVVGAIAAVKQDPTGSTYDFEWAIPLAELPFLRPEAQSCCGMTMFYTSAGQQLIEIMHLTDWRADSGGIEWRFWDTGLLYFAP